MLYINCHISNNNNEPLPSATAYVCDEFGTPIKRNNIVIIREADDTGKIIIPAQENDLVAFANKGYKPQIYPANNVPQQVILSKHNYKWYKRYLGVSDFEMTAFYPELILMSVFVICCTYLTKLVIKHIKK